MEFHAGQHDKGQNTDRIMRAMLKENEFIQRTLPHQIDRHRTHKHRADGKSDHDDDDVFGDRQRADYAVEGKRRIQHFKIEKAAHAAALDHVANLGIVFFHFENTAYNVDADIGEHAPEPGYQHSQLPALLHHGHARQQGGNRQHHCDRRHSAQ